MIKVGLLPVKGIEDYVKNFAKRLNAIQNTFRFKVYAPINHTSKLVSADEVENYDAYRILLPIKKKHNLLTQDSLIAFTTAILSQSEKNLTNLFSTGLLNKKIFVISLRFLRWGIIEGKLTEEIKLHVLAHLLVGILIKTYAKLISHYDTRGCLMDFCNRLTDFNFMLAKKYYLCDYCKENIEGHSWKLFIKLLSELRSEKGYSKSVLLIGSYNKESEDKLEKIKSKLNNLGYQAFLARDVPDYHRGSRERKFVNLASQSHFIVCENSFASGHIDELRMCIGNEFVTCILQESKHNATSLQIHYPYLYKFIKIFCYGKDEKNINHHVCRYRAKDLDSAIEKASQWAEQFYERYEDVFYKIYNREREIGLTLN